MNKPLIIILSSFLLFACANQPQNVISSGQDLTGKSISNIRPVGVRLAKMPAPQMDTQKAIAKYQHFLEISPNNDTRVHVLHRLADLTYQKVLTLFPNRRDSDMLLYQLAKVYMLKGDTDAALNALETLTKNFPNSPRPSNRLLMWCSIKKIIASILALNTCEAGANTSYINIETL